MWATEGFETAAVITMTEEEAFDISRLLQNRGLEVSYVDRDSSAFRKGVDSDYVLSGERGWNLTRYLQCGGGMTILWQCRQNISAPQERCMNCMYIS